MTQPYKVCPKCQQPAVMTMQACGRCGHVYRSAAPPDRTLFVSPAPTKPAFSKWADDTDDKPDQFAIGALWIFWIVGWSFYFYYVPMSLVFDGIACLIALYVTFSKSAVDRTHGGIKLLLEFIGFVSAFCYVAAHQHH